MMYAIITIAFTSSVYILLSHIVFGLFLIQKHVILFFFFLNLNY